MRNALVFVAVLGMVASAQAAWVQTSDTTVLIDGRLEVQVVPMGPAQGLCGPLDTYQINLNALAPADTVVGVDVMFIACETPMYQLGYWHAVPALRTLTPDMFIAQWLTNIPADTHFLLNADGLSWNGDTIATGHGAEDNDWMCGNNGVEDEGWGTFLASGALFISAHASQTPGVPLPFAWIAVPAGAPVGAVRLVNAVGGGFANGAGYIFETGTDCTDGIPIPLVPEPATMSALAVGALALLARRRRR